MKTLTVVLLGAMLALAFLAGFGFRGALAQQSPTAGQSAEPLPPDIRPESLSRMPWATKDEFTSEEEKQSFDHVVHLAPQSNSLKGPIGPTGTRLHIPVVAEAYYTAFGWLREKAGLEPRYVELAILLATRESGNEYEWLQHERGSVKFLPREPVEVVRNGKDTKGLDEKDAVLIQFGREVFHQPIVSSKTFAEMERLFGRKGTLAATLLMGHYTLNALMLHAYNQQLSPGDKHPFPPTSLK
jgi:4-carboxymuconolactone decarboxylase